MMLIHSLGTTSNIVIKCVCVNNHCRWSSQRAVSVRKTPCQCLLQWKFYPHFKVLVLDFKAWQEDDTFIHHNHHHANMCKYNETALAKPIILVLLISYPHIYVTKNIGVCFCFSAFSCSLCLSETVKHSLGLSIFMPVLKCGVCRSSTGAFMVPVLY